MTKIQKINRKKEPFELVSYGQLLLPPVVPNSEVTALCGLLDDFYKTYPSQHKRQKASDLVKGAFYAARPECRSNPDWMSQAANSARDVLYPLFSSEFGGINLVKLFRKYADSYKTNINNKEFVDTFTRLDEIYKKLSDITHHGTRPKLNGFSGQKEFQKFTDEDFESLLEEYTLTLKRAFSLQQIYTHTVIESILQNKKGKKTKDEVSLVLGVNQDASQYFFSKADEKWLGWLWKNGFLEVIKEKALDTNSYGFTMPELHYLVNIAEKNPDTVSKIICSFKISHINFNPEVIDQFTRISSKLPARCLEKIVKKIRDEQWISLMGKYTQYGFEYADMLESLQKAGDFQSILVLAEAILQVRSKEDIKERKISYRGDDVFYIQNLPETKVFNRLVEIPQDYLEKALSIVVNVFTEAIKDEGGYLLIDEDFFTLNLNSVAGDSYREEFKFLVATIVELTRKISSNKSFDNKEIYRKYFDKLPKNQITRRLKLFVLSLDPKRFIEELKAEYFKLFETEKIVEVLYGAEYERALKSGFSSLTDDQKREYVTKIFGLFSIAKDEEDRRWKRHYASCILSTISKDLTKDEIALTKKNEFKIDSKYEPEPTVGRTRSGTVTPRSPIDFTKFTVKEIAEKLVGELSPDELKKKYRNDDFLNPRDADGVAEQLKGDVKNRINDYLENATLFFDRKNLIPHYTNAYLRGIKDTLSENRNELDKLNYDELFKLLLLIKDSGESESFSKTDKDSEGRWLSNWNSVHSTIADLVEELIKQKDKKTLLNFKKYRVTLLEILEYLLKFNDPIPEDEKLKTAKSTIKQPNESEYSISDPFTIAINSVRGRAFQTLLHFVYQDASSNEKIKLADDVKAIYDKLLKQENTRAIMFMFGHYLPSFYFRDMEWVRGKFDEIFESESKDKHLKLAVWEGYLSNNLYKELFFEPYIQKLYNKNISLNLLYPKQKFFKDPQESLAIHLALAFVHYEEFGFDNKLFKEFLDKASAKQLSEFISFLGRSFVAGENFNILKDEKSPWRLERIKDFWDLMLKNKGNSPSLKEFGTWIEVNNNVFEVKWLAKKISQTLDSTGGDLKWDYGLIKSIEKLSAEAPQEALETLEKHFLSAIEDKQNIFPIQADKEWYSAFKILYGSGDKKIRDNTYSLINKLIEKGGRQFWSLEDIVNNNADE
jgi:hypothetical protein